MMNIVKYSEAVKMVETGKEALRFKQTRNDFFVWNAQIFPLNISGGNWKKRSVNISLLDR
jgi:hypothetical protein